MFEPIDIDDDNEETTEDITKIAWDLTKKSLTITDIITVTITNNGIDSISGKLLDYQYLQYVVNFLTILILLLIL